ncbi:MAG: HAD family phosphatase [Phycisphaeraceae bacterium]|nr:HAD family phosphatase [Phycisphaeraceae bacterium]
MKYRMLAIDLDGTLLGPNGTVSPANQRAVRQAAQQGVRVVPCTGRAWRESHAFLEPLTDAMPVGVFVTGTVVNDLKTGRAIEVRGYEPELAHRVIRSLYDLPDAVLVFRERSLAGHDYLVTGTGRVSENTRWWFDATNVEVCHQPEPTGPHLDHVLRIGIVASPSNIETAGDRLGNGLSDLVHWHHFAALPAPDGPMHVMEVFPRGMDKWAGLKHLAAQWDIQPHEIAAIGDEVNDACMVAQAGCGIAMANATPVTLAAARHTTLACDQDGVAHAIDRLLEGEW